MVPAFGVTDGGSGVSERAKERIMACDRGGLCGLSGGEALSAVAALVGEDGGGVPYPHLCHGVLCHPGEPERLVQMGLRAVELAGVDAGPGGHSGVVGGDTEQALPDPLRCGLALKSNGFGRAGESITFEI